MQKDTNFLNQCLSIPDWARSVGRCSAWGYQQVHRGLPVVQVGESRGWKVHPPSADEWFRSRMKSLRKPARRAGTK